MSEIWSIIFFIGIPIALIFTIVAVISKRKGYALKSVALYLFIVGSYFFYRGWSTSYALILGGLIFILVSPTINIKDKKKNAMLLYLSLALTIMIFGLYAIITKAHLYSSTLEYSFKGNCNRTLLAVENLTLDVSIPPYYLGGCEILIKPHIHSSIPLIPLSKEVKIHLCSGKNELLSTAYKTKGTDHYSLYPPSFAGESSELYLCASYETSCGGCIAREKIK